MNNTNSTFQDYLKKYTDINNKFIDDFFSLYDVKTTDKDFVINLDKIVSWLRTLKKHLKKTLLESYEEDVDYKITIQPPHGKGRPSEDIMLTPTCFKRLAMMSRTAKAEEVREYFLKIEAHLDKYKNHIINAMNKKIEKYEKELKPQPEIKSEGVIYVLKTNEDIEGVYKIGRTRDFQARIKTHQSSHPDKLEIAYVYETENIEHVEKCLKDLLKDKAYRKRKEFYEINPDILKQLITLCDCLHLTVRKKPGQIRNPHCRYIINIHKKYSTPETNKQILLDKL